VAEFKHLAVAPTLLVRQNITKPIDAWKLALAWVLHMDPDNITAQEQRAIDRQTKQEELIVKRSQDRRALQDERLVEDMPTSDDFGM
jgi:hypothetical protein